MKGPLTGTGRKSSRQRKADRKARIARARPKYIRIGDGPGNHYTAVEFLRLLDLNQNNRPSVQRR